MSDFSAVKSSGGYFLDHSQFRRRPDSDRPEVVLVSPTSGPATNNAATKERSFLPTR